jgi:hypothetical protein
MKKSLITIFLLIVLAPYAAKAQQTTPQDSLLDRMVGEWVLKGNIAGAETIHDIRSEWVLNHQYIQIKEVSREKDTLGKPLYEAIVYMCWEQKLNRYACLWLDNTGNGGLTAQAVGHAKTNGDKIELLFDIDGGCFHTTFAYDKYTGTWQWIMDAEEKGKLLPFARVKLTKSGV